MQFSQKLTALMEERGWTQYRLAKMMDCSQSTVGHWLSGDTKPQRGTLKRLAEVFEVEPQYFVEPDIHSKFLRTGNRFKLEVKPASGDFATKSFTVTDELADCLEILRDRPDIRVLLHAAAGINPNQVERVGDMIASFKGGVNGQTD